MISLTDFRTIKQEVEDSINNTLDRIKALSKEHYITYLADGEYVHDIDTPENNLNPNLIDYQIDKYKDQTRHTFLARFLNKYYSPNNQNQTNNDIYQINIELMIYCHIWESRNFLKRLNRLTTLLIKENVYPWNISIMSKQKFIRENIRDLFNKVNCPLGKIMTEGFHTSLRNAFAHSDYYFNLDQNKIVLHNSTYNKNAQCKLDDITFDNWSKRFVYSALLSYHLLYISQQRRKNLINDFGTNTFPIYLPSKKDPSSVREVNIIYNIVYI